jgi:hypothetical protein
MDFSDSELAALLMIIGSRQAWVRRELIDLACGPATIGSLIASGHVVVWPVMIAIERVPGNDGGPGRVVSSIRVIFATLTPLGAERIGYEVAERSDIGEPYWTERGRDEDGGWALPTSPITSKGDRQTFGMPYPDMIAAPVEVPKATKPAKKVPTRAG